MTKQTNATSALLFCTARRTPPLTMSVSPSTSLQKWCNLSKELQGRFSAVLSRLLLTPMRLFNDRTISMTTPSSAFWQKHSGLQLTHTQANASGLTPVQTSQVPACRTTVPWREIIYMWALTDENYGEALRKFGAILVELYYRLQAVATVAKRTERNYQFSWCCASAGLLPQSFWEYSQVEMSCSWFPIQLTHLTWTIRS